MARIVAAFYTGAVAIEPNGPTNRALGSRPEAVINATDAYAMETEDETLGETFETIGSAFNREVGLVILTGLEGDIQVYIGAAPPKGNLYDIVLEGSQRAFGIRRGQRVYARDDA